MLILRGGQFNWIELPCTINSAQYASIDHTALTNSEYKLLAIKVRIEAANGRVYIGSFNRINRQSGSVDYPSQTCANIYSADGYENFVNEDEFRFSFSNMNAVRVYSAHSIIGTISAIGCVIDESNVDAWLNT